MSILPLEQGLFLLPNWLFNDSFNLSPPSTHHLTIENDRHPPIQSMHESLSFGFKYDEFKITKKKIKFLFNSVET